MYTQQCVLICSQFRDNIHIQVYTCACQLAHVYIYMKLYSNAYKGYVNFEGTKRTHDVKLRRINVHATVLLLLCCVAVLRRR